MCKGDRGVACRDVTRKYESGLKGRLEYQAKRSSNALSPRGASLLRFVFPATFWRNLVKISPFELDANLRVALISKIRKQIARREADLSFQTTKAFSNYYHRQWEVKI